MATLKLPTFRGDLDHKYNIVLDSFTYTVEFHFNARADRWTIHLFDAAGNAVRHGVRLAILDDILSRVALASKPPGPMPVVNTTGSDVEPDSANLGDEAQLRYVEA